jgi:hypothetical protein
MVFINMTKKSKLTQPQTPNEVQERDLFYTTKYAVDLLLPYIPSNIRYIIEPACGAGNISSVLEDNGFGVSSFDLDPAYSKGIQNNFLDHTIDLYDYSRTAIVTNPPYSLKKQFYKKCLEYQVPFALLIPADYCQWLINAIWKDGCEKIIPNRRINFITPFYITRINKAHNTTYKKGDDIPQEFILESVNKPGSMFHSMWLTYGFGIGKTETFIDLTPEMMKDIGKING